MSASYFLKTALNSGSALRIMKNSASPRIGTVPAKINASCLPTRMDITTANTSIIGARTAMRMHIMNAFWMFVTSVVSRVTSDEVENRSMFAKEKPCT